MRPVWDGAVAIARVIPRVSMPLTISAAALAVLVATMPVVLSVVSAHLVAESLDVHGTKLPASTLWLVLGIAAVLMIQEISRQSLTYVSRTLGRRVDVDLRIRALRASLSPVGISHLEDAGLRDVFGSARNLSPFAFTPGDAAQNLPFSFAMRFQTITAIAVIAFYEPALALL